MLIPEQRPITPDEMAALARHAFGSVLSDLVEIAGTNGKAGARARRLLRNVSDAVARGGGATEKSEGADGNAVSQRPHRPAK